MLTLVLAFSLMLGVVSMALIWGFDKTNAPESNTITDLKELERVLLRTLIIHQEQILYLEQQKIRVEEKNNLDLVSRYSEDIALLSEHSETLAKEVQILWQHRMIEEYKSDYTDVLRCFPSVDSLHSQSSKREYVQIIQELKRYAVVVEKKRKAIEAQVITVPAYMFPSSVLEDVHLVKQQTEEKYNHLSQKTDGLIDQLQYVCDAIDIRRMQDENTQRDSIESILEEFSVYLDSSDHLFDEHEFDIHINTQIQDVESISADMQSEIAAQREVEHYLRRKLKKKYSKQAQ